MIAGIEFFFFISVSKSSIACGCPPIIILILGIPSNPLSTNKSLYIISGFLKNHLLSKYCKNPRKIIGKNRNFFNRYFPWFESTQRFMGITSKLYSILLKLLQNLRIIENPVKYLRWSFLQKQLTAENHWLFQQKASS